MLAVRTVGLNSGNPQFLIPDRQGTDELSIDSATQAVTRRQYLPFGGPRGTAPTVWPGGDKGYVGGTPDPTTSLENLGAREYNPANGRFLSADPIFEQTDPTQMGGYDYAGNNPVTGSDPTGLMSNSCVDGCHDKGDPFALPGGGTAESGVGVVTPNPPPGGGGHSGGGQAASSGPSQNKKDIIGGWLSENCAQSSPICNRNGNDQINPNSIAVQAAYDCFKTSSCQTAGDLNALLDNRFNAALNHLGNVFNATIFWVSLLGSLVGGVGSAAAKRVLAGLLGTGGPAGAAAAGQDPPVPPAAGSLQIVGSGFSASEQGAAETLAAQGRNVVLREADPAAGRTSDLLVDGVPYDVYTPTTSNVSRIVSAVASKGSQVRGGGIVIDLSKSPITPEELGNILPRVQGITNQISEIVVIP